MAHSKLGPLQSRSAPQPLRNERAELDRRATRAQRRFAACAMVAAFGPSLAQVPTRARAADAARWHCLDCAHGRRRQAAELVAGHVTDHMGTLCFVGDNPVRHHSSAPLARAIAYEQAVAASVSRRDATRVLGIVLRGSGDDVTRRGKCNRVHHAAVDHAFVGPHSRGGRRCAALDRRSRGLLRRAAGRTARKWSDRVGCAAAPGLPNVPRATTTQRHDCLRAARTPRTHSIFSRYWAESAYRCWFHFSGRP